MAPFNKAAGAVAILGAEAVLHSQVDLLNASEERPNHSTVNVEPSLESLSALSVFRPPIIG